MVRLFILVVINDQANLWQLNTTLKCFLEIVLNLVEVVQTCNFKESVLDRILDLEVVRVLVVEQVLELRIRLVIK